MEDKQKLIGDVKIPFKKLLKRSSAYIKTHIFALTLALLLMVLCVALDVCTPIIYQKVVDELNKGSTDLTVLINLKLIILLAAMYFGVYVVSQLFRFFVTLILQKTGNQIVCDLRKEVFKHIESMSLDQFEVMPVGSLVTRVCNYTSQISDLFTNQITQLLCNILLIISVFVMMIRINLVLSLIMFAIGIFVFVISLIFRKRIGRLSRLEKGYLSDLNTTLSEDLSGMKVIQLFNKEEEIKKQFEKKNKTYRDNRYKIMVSFSVYRPLIIFCQTLGTAILFFLSAKLHLTAGSVVAFAWYIEKFFQPIQSISDQVLNIERALTSTERLFNLLDVQPKVVDKPDAKEIDHFDGKIEFKNVWFSYDDKNWVLKDVSFVVEKGDTCAFVGATGAGKTTILSLLTKAYSPQKGQILIDGEDISNIKIKSIRAAVGQMLQDVFLFSGTIKSNITLFDDRFSEEEINEACKSVNANVFIDKLPDGLDTKVVERGDNFSQGQRQLMSFARTIIHKPQIVLLDEATANIDTETEALIQDSLEKMSSLGTMLVVAHRLSTIQNADQIICLQNGEIVERGTHNELLKNKGYYYKLNKLNAEKSE